MDILKCSIITIDQYMSQMVYYFFQGLLQLFPEILALSIWLMLFEISNISDHKV